MVRRMRRKALCLMTCFIYVLFPMVYAVSSYSTTITFDLRNRVNLLITSLEFNLHTVIDSSITDLPPKVDRGEHHSVQIETDFVTGNTFAVNELILNVDPILQNFGTEYHLEDYAEYGLPILETILATAGVTFPAAGLVEVARQILIHTDIVLYLDLSSEITVSGPGIIDREKLTFRDSKIQEFILSINEKASHNEKITVSNQFSLDSRFMFDLDKSKVPDLIYSTVNAFLRLPWEVVLGSDYGDVTLETTAIVFDHTPPSVTIIEPYREAVFFSRAIDLRWQGIDDYALDYYRLRFDEGGWNDVGLDTSRIFRNLSPGRHTVEVQGIDVAGNKDADTVTFYIRPEAGPWPAFGDLLLRIPVVNEMVLALDDLVPGYGSILLLLIVVLLVGFAFVLKYRLGERDS